MVLITRKTMSDHYRQLGLEKGDIVLMRSSLSAIGAQLDNRMDYINAVLDVIGETGTLVGLSFSKSFFTPLSPPRSFVFDKNAPAITGGLANLMLSHPMAVRSQHPTNSFAAIGAEANELMAHHDETTHAYFPMEKLLERDAKMILVGCVNDSPGFTTTHLAEYRLGYLKNITFPSLHRVWFKKNGKTTLYKRTELGSDSSTFSKYYAHYRLAGILKEGLIGNAQSMLINCQGAYDIEYNILKNDPRFHLCDRPQCHICRGRHLFNKKDWVPYYLKMIKKKLLR